MIELKHHWQPSELAIVKGDTLVTGLISPFRVLRPIKGVTHTTWFQGPDPPVLHSRSSGGNWWPLQKLSELRHKARTPHCVCAKDASSRPSTPHEARAHLKPPKPGRAVPVARPSRTPVHARASLPRTTAVPCPSVGWSGSPDASRALLARLTSAATGLARLLVLARRRHSLKERRRGGGCCGGYEEAGGRRGRRQYRR